MGNWVIDLDNTVFGNLRRGLEAKFSEKSGFEELFITSSSRTDTTAKFPTVYMQVLAPVERGKTFDVGVCGVMYTVQIEVTAIKSESQAKQVMAEVINIMSAMYFEGTSLPYLDNTEDTYRMIARFRRMIGAGDTIPFIS